MNLSYRLLSDERQTLDLFGGIGYTNAQFKHYTQTSGASANGNRLPFAPEITFNGGAQYGVKISGDLHTWVRAEVLGVGHYFYDASNAASQDTYILTNFRVGVGGVHWRWKGSSTTPSTHTMCRLPSPSSLPPAATWARAVTHTLGINLGLSY